FSVFHDSCPSNPYSPFYFGVKSFFLFLSTLVRSGFSNIAISSEEKQQEPGVSIQNLILTPGS
ncbi:hypothetical protein L9W92_13775, partial [Pelotomaculum terephthalicicum JT]|uniref:hypothetical protein n=1 Tax=Pelotomaculum terephthalicicum TaxID=206393 RepID=UPI001F03C5A9